MGKFENNKGGDARTLERTDEISDKGCFKGDKNVTLRVPRGKSFYENITTHKEEGCLVEP